MVPGPTEIEAIETAKLLALTAGVRVERSVLDSFGGPAALTVHEYATTGGITLELAHGVLVNAPFDDPHCTASPLELVSAADGGVVLSAPDFAVGVVGVLPLPGYLARRDAEGNLIADVAMSHADRIRLSPIVGCAYDCGFCDLASMRYEQRPLTQVLNALDAAREDKALPPRHMLISGGSPAFRHSEGQRYFADVCEAVLEHVRKTANPFEGFDVDIMMSAREDGPEFVERLVHAGVNGFSFNIELFDHGQANRHMKLKHKWARPALERTIARAVELLGREEGKVRSLIIAGLERSESTIAGVQWLAERGCSPVLSPFRPARGTALAEAGPCGGAALREILDASREIVARERVLLGPACVPCQHNTAAFPWDVSPR